MGLFVCGSVSAPSSPWSLFAPRTGVVMTAFRIRCAGLVLVAIVCSLAANHPTLGADLSDLNEADTSRASREAAIRAIPLQQMTADARARVLSVVSRPSLYRRMPIKIINCDPDLYTFMVRHPEVIVNMWQLMGVTKVQLKRTGEFKFEAEDGAGTTGKVELIYGDRNVHVMYCDGLYEGALFKRKIVGRCVMMLSSGYTTGPDQRPIVTNRLDLFLQLDNIGVDLIARTLHPLVGKTADNNFQESVGFLGQVSDVAERNGPGMQRLAARLANIEEPIRQQFANLTAAINHRAILREDTASDVVTDSAAPPAAGGRLTDQLFESSARRRGGLELRR